MHFDGGEHQAVAVVSTSVRLHAPAGTESVVLASYLMTLPGFMVVDRTAMQRVEPFGLLDGLPDEVLAKAREWEQHLVDGPAGRPLHNTPHEDLLTQARKSRTGAFPIGPVRSVLGAADAGGKGHGAGVRRA